MTMSENPEGSGKPGPSVYSDEPFRTKFVMTAALSSLEGDLEWSDTLRDVFRKAMDETKEHSNTPYRDGAFIEGVVCGLIARRLLDVVGKRL